MGSNPISSVFELKMFFYIKISAKEKKGISDFITFISKTKLFKFVTVNQIPKKKKRKFVTILKSPHVNKTAQEQFEFKFYNRQFFIFSAKPFISFFILKKIKNSTFSGINLEIKCLFEKTKITKHLLSILNPDNLDLNLKYYDNKINHINNYLNLLDCFGEVVIKK